MVTIFKSICLFLNQFSNDRLKFSCRFYPTVYNFQHRFAKLLQSLVRSTEKANCQKIMSLSDWVRQQWDRNSLVADSSDSTLYCRYTILELRKGVQEGGRGKGWIQGAFDPLSIFGHCLHKGETTSGVQRPIPVSVQFKYNGYKLYVFPSFIRYRTILFIKLQYFCLQRPLAEF